MEHSYKKAGKLLQKFSLSNAFTIRPSLRMQTQTLSKCNNSTSGSLSDYHAYLQQMLSIGIVTPKAPSIQVRWGVHRFFFIFFIFTHLKPLNTYA